MKVLKIGAIWCNACNVMRPRWKKIEEENEWLETEYFDFDEEEELVEKYEITDDKVPVFIYLDKEGNEVGRQNGEVSEADLLEAINKYKEM